MLFVKIYGNKPMLWLIGYMSFVLLKNKKKNKRLNLVMIFCFSPCNKIIIFLKNR
jgi:hypothetical protein